MVEPALPGAVDHYVNLEPCCDAAALAGLREELTAAMTGYKACYQRAYRCLEAACDIRVNCRSRLSPALAEAKLAKRVRSLTAREFKSPGGGGGRVTRRFLSAISCQGRLCQWETVGEQCGRVYVLEDSFGFAHRLLLPILTAASAAGHDAVACLSPTQPDRLEHLLLPALGLAVVSSTPGLPYPGKAHRRIRLDTLLDPASLRRERPRLRFAAKLADTLEGEAVRCLAEAKAMHDELEALYRPHVNFSQVDEAAGQLLDRLGLPREGPFENL